MVLQNIHKKLQNHVVLLFNSYLVGKTRDEADDNTKSSSFSDPGPTKKEQGIVKLAKTIKQLISNYTYRIS